MTGSELNLLSLNNSPVWTSKIKYCISKNKKVQNDVTLKYTMTAISVYLTEKLIEVLGC